MLDDATLISHLPPGKFATNMAQFCRCLRSAGLPVGPGKVLEALKALEAAGFTNRHDFYWILHAVLVNRRDQQEIFDQAFHIFWRNPKLLERMMSLMLPQLDVERDPEAGDTMSRRVSEAMQQGEQQGENQDNDEEDPPEIEIDAQLTFSEREILQTRDFEQMTAEEIEKAKAAIARMSLPIRDVATRRFRKTPLGSKIDMRTSLRTSMRKGADVIHLARKQRLTRPPPLVVMCDISGSMSRYSRMLLHFLHVMSNDRDRVHSFVFGTRLTNITRHLRHKDVDQALESVAESVEDWSGGTRIGTSLAEFNKHWSRRVLAQGAVVMLVTDGLDREGGESLAFEIDRLHRSCRTLIWLNPLLRFDGYQPIAAGARAIIRHVDVFRAAHNLESLSDLAQLLGQDDLTQTRDSLAHWTRLVRDHEKDMAA